MRYKSLFRVLVKVIGVWMIATALSVLGSKIMTVCHDAIAFSINFGNVEFRDFITAEVAEATVQLFIGLLLFFRSNWIANLAIPSNRPYCVECGYDLTGHAADNCPECGTTKLKGDGL